MAFTESTSVVFTAGIQALLRSISTIILLFGIAITSFWIGRRTDGVNLFRHRAGSNVVRNSLLILLIFAWLLFLYSAIMILGIGLSLGQGACSAGLTGCVVLFFTAKAARYMILLEKVYVVWPKQGTRLSSTAYRFGFSSMFLLVAMMVAALYGRRSHVGDDGECRVGFKLPVAITLLVFDFGTMFILSVLFLLPLRRYIRNSPSIRRVAGMNLLATMICLTCSLLNLGAITLLDGREYGWIFLTTCSASICIQALVGIYITSAETGDHANGTVASHAFDDWPFKRRMIPRDPLAQSTVQQETLFDPGSPFTTPRRERFSSVDKRKSASRSVVSAPVELPPEVVSERVEGTVVTVTLPYHRRGRCLSKSKKGRSVSRGTESSGEPSTLAPSTMDQVVPPLEPSGSVFYPFPPIAQAITTDEALVMGSDPNEAIPVLVNPRRPAISKRRVSHTYTSSAPDLSLSHRAPTLHPYHYRRRASSLVADPVLPVEGDELPMRHSNLRKTPYPFGGPNENEEEEEEVMGGDRRMNAERSKPWVRLGDSLPVMVPRRRGSEWDPSPRMEDLEEGAGRVSIRDALENYEREDLGGSSSSSRVIGVPIWKGNRDGYEFPRRE